jgi:hypothetical protein
MVEPEAFRPDTNDDACGERSACRNERYASGCYKIQQTIASNSIKLDEHGIIERGLEYRLRAGSHSIELAPTGANQGERRR